jgi:hypothetical protein
MNMRQSSFLLLPIMAAALTGLLPAQQCQPPRELRPAAANLDFSQGAAGTAPPVWLLGPEWFMPPHQPVYEAVITSGAACNGGAQCAMVRSLRDDPSVRFVFLYQVVEAAAFTGRRITLRAAVRVTPGTVARLLVRVHRHDCGTSFRDDMGNHPITSDTWAAYEIQAPIAIDARDIEFGVQVIGQGAAWIDHLTLEPSDR